MDAVTSAWLDSLKAETIQVAKQEIKDLLDELAKDSEAAIRENGAKLETAIKLLSTGVITKEQFYGLVVDSRELLMAGLRVKTAEAKKRARDFAWRISFQVFGSLLAVL